jgi:hypothetical protein
MGSYTFASDPQDDFPTEILVEGRTEAPGFDAECRTGHRAMLKPMS